MKKILLFVAAAMVAMSANAAFYVAGNGAADATGKWCDGKNWAADGSEMVGNTITFSGVPAGTYEFKVTDGTWGFALNIYNVDAAQSTPGYEGTDNVKFTIASTADITISTDGSNIVLKSTVPFGKVVITSWSIAGVADLMGEEWSPSAEANVMTEKSAGVYELVKQGVSLTAGTYDYKACANKAWSISEIPASGNQTLEILEDGVYDITFTLTVGEGYLEAVATLVGEGGDQGGEEGGDDPIDTPAGADYYLIGYINGADYGDKADAANLGEYKFVDGTLVATFTEDSYVAIKNGDMTKWYFAEAYAGESPVTLETGKDFGEKMKVPGSVEVTFTLVENGDGSLTLSYTTGGTTDIEDIDAEDAIVAAYDLIGRPVAADAKGFVILQYASGKAVKVFNN